MPVIFLKQNIGQVYLERLFQNPFNPRLLTVLRYMLWAQLICMYYHLFEASKEECVINWIISSASTTLSA